MSVAAARMLADEARRAVFEVRDDLQDEPVGPIGVSGMLAEQLVKELAVGAEPGSVLVGGAELATRAEALIRIVAGDPTPEDDELVRVADAEGIPVVIVQLWPQADWTRPFVLTPFVVECRTGEGFPIREIADRVVESVERDAALAARVPVLAGAARSGAITSALLRAGVLGFLGARSGVSRPLLTLEQIRLLSHQRTVSGSVADDELRVRAAGAGAVLASGFAFRALSRSLRGFLPAPLANAAVAVGGTWALAKLAELAQAQLERSP